MRAEGPRQHDAVHVVDTALVHQQARAGIERGFRELDGADIALRHADARPADIGGVVDQVGMGAVRGLAARGAGGLGRADQARRVEQARHAHFRHRLDDARAADAGDAGVPGGLGEAVLGGPQV